jgi:hypothetical protein
MTALINALNRCIRGTCHGLSPGGDALSEQLANSKPRYVRAHNGGRDGVYRVLEKRVDHLRKAVKRYKRVRDGPKVHFEKGPDEWTASRGQSPRSGKPYRKPKHASVGAPHSDPLIRIDRKESTCVQGVEVVAASRPESPVGNSRRRKVRKDDWRERSAHHKLHVQFTRQSIRRETQMAHLRTVVIVEDLEENDVTSESYPDDTSCLHVIHSTSPSSGSPIRRPRLTSPFQQPQMTIRESQAMVFGRNAQIRGELSGSHCKRASDPEHIIEQDDGFRCRQRSR